MCIHIRFGRLTWARAYHPPCMRKQLLDHVAVGSLLGLLGFLSCGSHFQSQAGSNRVENSTRQGVVK